MNKTQQAQQIATLAIVRDAEQTVEIAYGEKTVDFRVGPGESGVKQIDAAFLSGRSTLRLNHINQCLKLAGKDPTDKEARKWFNHNVRDTFHASLRYVTKQLMQAGRPTSISMTRRLVGKAKNPVITGKVGYEVSLIPTKPANAGELASGKAKTISQGKAKRQARKSIKSNALRNPVIPNDRQVDVNTPVTVDAQPSVAQ
jgi:hypothetical protein